MLCWINGNTSAREIVAYLGRLDENDSNAGCEDNDDENAERLDEAMNEIERRESACASGYPFALTQEGTVLQYPILKPEETQKVVYLYLLLSTRLNMKDNRNHAGIDGTNLLEPLSAHVLKNYLGRDKAQSLVFGTSGEGSFEDKVNKLCHNLREGSRFQSLDNAPVKAKDAKLDAVAWVPFADRLPSQLIIFGQCKTGTTWRDTTSQLQPEQFIKKWVREPFLVNPTRVFCVSEAINRSIWKSSSVEAGIVFDRCRLVENCIGLPEETFSSIRTWTLEAKKTVTTSLDKTR